MPYPLPLLCGADPYLTRIHLQELFDQYMSASHPTASVFSVLVSSVRQPYLIELMAAKDALLAQQVDHARQISKLHAAYQRERAAGPVSGGPDDSAPLTKAPPAPACDVDANEDGAAEHNESGATLPAVVKAHELLHKSSILYVSRSVSQNRDWVSWANYDFGPAWKEHLKLNVFKSKQPGTIEIGVVGGWAGTPMEYVVGPDDADKPCTREVSFWAYPRPVPGTRMISIVSLDNMSGCIFVSDGEGEVDDWQCFLQLWVPV